MPKWWVIEKLISCVGTPNCSFPDRGPLKKCSEICEPYHLFSFGWLKWEHPVYVNISFGACFKPSSWLRAIIDAEHTVRCVPTYQVFTFSLLLLFWQIPQYVHSTYEIMPSIKVFSSPFLIWVGTLRHNRIKERAHDLRLGKCVDK